MASDPDEKTARQNEQFVCALLGAGWKRTDDDMIVHPHDPDINVYFNPYSKQLLLSAKLVLALKKSTESPD